MLKLKTSNQFCLALFVLIFSLTSRSSFSATVLEEWKALPPKVLSCVKELLRPVDGELERIIAAGVRPSNPNYASGLETCKKISNGMRKNYSCTLQDQSGNTIQTICNEFLAVQRSGQFVKISDEEAIRLIASKQEYVQFYNEETPEGLNKRMQAINAEINSGTTSTNTQSSNTANEVTTSKSEISQSPVNNSINSDQAQNKVIDQQAQALDEGLCTGAVGGATKIGMKISALSQVALEEGYKVTQQYKEITRTWSSTVDTCTSGATSMPQIKTCIDNKISDKRAASYFTGFVSAMNFVGLKNPSEAELIANSLCVKLRK